MIRKYQVEIEGLTPVLHHDDSIEWADAMEAWRNDPANKGKSKAGDDRTPSYRWVGYTYNDGEVVTIPSENISRCLMEGGALVPTGKGQKTFKAQSQSGMRVDALHVPLIVNGKTIPWSKIEALVEEPDFTKHTEAVKPMGFTLFTKRAKVGQAKHIRVRPKFTDWRLSIPVVVWDEAITTSVLESIFKYAGQYKGLCDWRPGSKTPGPYGMFRLESLTQVPV